MDGAERTRARGKAERGQSIVEFALVFPVFVVLVFGIIDFGMALRAYITVTNAAREGARYAIVCPASDGAIKDRVVDYSNGLIKKADVSVSWKNASTNASMTRCTTDSYAQVDASHTYNFITPLGSFVTSLSGKQLKFSSTTRMRVE